MRHDIEDEGIAAVGGLEDPVRRRLYVYVWRRGEAVSRDEAASAAGIGRPLAAYHLDKLVELGLLTASYRRPPGRRGPGAGRPAKVYAKSDREFTVSVPPREYELAARLLAQAVEADGSGAARAALGHAARRLGADLGRSSRAPAAGAADEDEMTGAEAALTHHGFEPERAGDGTVTLANCPFHKLAAQYPDIVCGMNLALIGGLVEGLGLAGLRPVLDPQPGRCCVAIRPANPASGDLEKTSGDPSENGAS
ncbi:MAG TPA: helix-turn-helix domain-containing protein [Streptosporangiaceae bacterium]|nr:helix-turn-helix domain-containing protein [Streptosporangiaceae bacterium]